MHNENLHDSSSDTINGIIDEKIEQLVNEASLIISSYWVWTDNANQSIRSAKEQAKKRGDTDDILKRRYSNIGPRIEKSKTTYGSRETNKPRLVWCFYPNEPIRRRAGKSANGVKFTQFATRIKMSNNSEYSVSTLLKYGVGWNAQKIIETEKKLMPIREQIEALHKARVTISKVPKRINRIAKKYEEYNHA